jgi:hypothetical protein
MMQMIETDQLSRDDVLDALLDLKHDLGKYIRMPVAMLPREASNDDLREALETALLRTRSGPGGSRTAADLWKAFTEEVGGAIDGYESTPGLRAAVDRALEWRAALERNEGAIDRGQVEADTGAVGEAIQRLIEEVHGGDR